MLRIPAPLTALALLLIGTAPHALGQAPVTFENPTLAQPLPGPNSYENGANLNPPGSFTASGVTFNNEYDTASQSWAGWSYSNVQDLTTPGFTNQYAAYNLPGGGSGAGGSANYGVAFQQLPFAGNPGLLPTIALPTGQRPVSIAITNTTYAALSIQNGDGFAKKFGGPTGNDADFFLLTITGHNGQNQATGVVDFYLADYQSADNSKDYIVSQWTTVDLSTLASDTTQLAFSLTSTDVGAFGINTPLYFAADNFTSSFVPVPEPSSIGLIAAGGFGLWRLGRRRLGC